MSTQDSFLHEIFTKIEEAEKLAAYAEGEQHSQADRAGSIVRWLIVADEATALIIRAKEHLDERELAELEQEIDLQFPGAWNEYSQNVRRFKQFRGKELYEQ